MNTSSFSLSACSATIFAQALLCIPGELKDMGRGADAFGIGLVGTVLVSSAVTPLSPRNSRRTDKPVDVMPTD